MHTHASCLPVDGILWALEIAASAAETAHRLVKVARGQIVVTGELEGRHPRPLGKESQMDFALALLNYTSLFASLFSKCRV